MHGEDQQSYGRDIATPLHIAAYCGSRDAVLKLLQALTGRSSVVVVGMSEQIARQKGHDAVANSIRHWVPAAGLPALTLVTSNCKALCTAATAAEDEVDPLSHGNKLLQTHCREHQFPGGWQDLAPPVMLAWYKR
mmetsp:Transcript_44841/g.105159  ORF Transcript_44841/g.105159 Transcript_44841/m.105159 type:complete len:135 (+) Transcript_44841:895-1299(+)|eukprot:3938202-Rhodomonas_salina.2